MTNVLTGTTLGDRIKEARNRAGFSHDRLATAIGTSRRHLIRLEKNENRPRPEMLARIAEATKTKIEELDPAAEDDEESDPVADLLSAIRRMIRDEVRSLA